MSMSDYGVQVSRKIIYEYALGHLGSAGHMTLHLD